MKIMLRALSLFALLLFSQHVFSQDLDRHSVINRLIESYGGEENLRKLDSVVQEWDMVALMSKRHGKDIRGIQPPNRLMVKLSYPNKVERRILNGEEGLVLFDGREPQVATDPQRDAMRLQLMRLYSPLVLRSKIENITLTLEGEFCALTLLEHGVQADYLVNLESWRIEKVAGTLNMGGGDMQFITEYSDFEFVEGVLVHRQENKFAGNVNTALLKLRDFQFNANLDGNHFFIE